MNSLRTASQRASTCILTLLLAAGIGCTSGENEVVVFSALDQEFAEPILNDFESKTGIKVLPLFDVESTKTVQLVARILNERRPTCDVFWNNEILHTLRLQRRGRLDRLAVIVPKSFPAAYQDTDGHWIGLAARARVLIVNTDLVPRDRWPESIHDLTDESWRGQVGIAKPLFGTTATHAAVLFATWGEQQALQFFRDIKRNAVVLSGNKQVAVDVARGRLAFGITDTDDAIVEQDKGRPVEIIFPDQQPGAIGSLFIPNTVCVVKNGPNPVHAQRLAAYLLSPEVEAILATGRSAQFPVNPDVTASSRAIGEEPIKWMEVNFSAAADQWETVIRLLRAEFSE